MSRLPLVNGFFYGWTVLSLPPPSCVPETPYFTAMVSISTSAPKREGFYGEGCPCRRIGRIIPSIDFIHRPKMIHIAQKDRRFDHMAEIVACGFQNGTDVLHDLLRLLTDASFD